MAVATRARSFLSALLLSIVLTIGGGGRASAFAYDVQQLPETSVSVPGFEGKWHKTSVRLSCPNKEACSRCCSPFHCAGIGITVAAALLGLDFAASVLTSQLTAPLISNLPRGFDPPPKRLAPL